MDVAVVGKERRVSAKTEGCSTGLSTSLLLKGDGKKATNKDLPAGARPWYRQDVVPTIFHWVGGKVADPFNIQEHELVGALKLIWAHEFGGQVPLILSPTLSLVM